MSKKTTKAIIENANDYLIGVKKNQPRLYAQIQATTSEPSNIHGKYSQLELNKGRLERREVYVSNNLTGISDQWMGLKAIIKVKRWTKRKQGISEETAFFISSKQTNALHYFDGIRSHWEIENSLHWVKDVTFREDASLIRTNQAPENMSTFRNISLNIFRHNGFSNMAVAKRLVCNDIPRLCQLII